MSDEIEIEDDITESEMQDDALESKMKKLEKDASRLLNDSNALLQALNRERAKKEEVKQADNQVIESEENKVSS